MTRASFTVGDARRIANAVRVVELGNRNEAPLTFRRVLEAPTPKVFRIGTFSGAWDIGSLKVVTFKYQTNTPNTASVSNLFWPIPDSGTRDCSIAKEGTAWYLLVPRMFAADAVTAATVTTAALEFKTVPVAALASSGTSTFAINLVTVEPVVSVTLGASSLSFSRKSVGVLIDGTAASVSISITTCATATP